jgi:hypothetical protein
MVEEKMLIKTINKVKTEIYYLGHFAMEALHREKVPDVDARQNQFQEFITIRSDNGFRVRNKRQNTARTSSIKRQEPPTSKKSSVTPSTKKKARTGPKPTLSSSDEESFKNLTEPSSKNKDGTQINVKSTSDDESESSDEGSSDDNTSRGPSSDGESENPNIPYPTQPPKQSVSAISCTVSFQISDQFEMAATHILHSTHSPKQHSSH